MYVYVEWKIDLENPNKVNILRITEEKDPTLKYVISGSKFILGNVYVDNNNFNQDQIFFTRVIIGNMKENFINLTVLEEIQNNDKKITISIFGNKNIQTSSIKEIHKSRIFINYGINNNENENNIDKELNKFVKEIRKNNIQTKYDKYGNPYTIYLNQVNIN